MTLRKGRWHGDIARHFLLWQPARTAL